MLDKLTYTFKKQGVSPMVVTLSDQGILIQVVGERGDLLLTGEELLRQYEARKAPKTPVATPPKAPAKPKKAAKPKVQAKKVVTKKEKDLPDISAATRAKLDASGLVSLRDIRCHAGAFLNRAAIGIGAIRKHMKKMVQARRAPQGFEHSIVRAHGVPCMASGSASAFLNDYQKFREEHKAKLSARALTISPFIGKSNGAAAA